MPPRLPPPCPAMPPPPRISWATQSWPPPPAGSLPPRPARSTLSAPSMCAISAPVRSCASAPRASCPSRACPPPRRARTASSNRSTLLAPTPSWTASPSTPAVTTWAASWRSSARSRPTWSSVRPTPACLRPRATLLRAVFPTVPASSRTATWPVPSSSPRRSCAPWACASSSTRSRM
ncbi:Uncharacterised protein [Collinsella intestinalis]|nr:Uncharacterised protein [Collinsella intestinalis]